MSLLRGSLSPSAHGWRFLRFAVVGLSGVAVNSSVLVIAAEVGRLPPVLAAALACETAIISNFIANSLWTFRGAASPVGRLGRLVRYNTICVGALVINVAVVWAMTSTTPIHYLAANLMGIAFGMVWNYGLNTTVTWAVADRG